MAQSKNDTPAVTTYADYELITPPNRLRGAVAEVPNGSDDPVARAEAALAQLASEFSSWMDAECARLTAARDAVRQAGFTAATREMLFHAAHDIKGEAATFGFPAVADVANSLCRLIEYSPELARVPLELIDQHVDAVRAIIREYARDDVEEVSGALTAKLRAVTDEFLLSENKHRPDYLEMIRGPALVPDDQAG
jgi:HPt (histidine-containing phosphotransfer) domain-containing protein